MKNQRTVGEVLESVQPLKEAIEEFRKAKVAEQMAQDNSMSTGSTADQPKPPEEEVASHGQQIDTALAGALPSLSLSTYMADPMMKFVGIARRTIAATVVPCSALA